MFILGVKRLDRYQARATLAVAEGANLAVSAMGEGGNEEQRTGQLQDAAFGPLLSGAPSGFAPNANWREEGTEQE